MRLIKVKLSGFKSFVDTTTFHLTGRLNGIVGPNGCGKSNIIDAVRWVMGESSARQLRGQSMADVIFNGSTHRKPAGMASIELVFDNSRGRLEGEWAAYNEISIRRLLDREGRSQYFLNGTRCRRRDITDIFMGTGLGPRSYAIIEQGMISRIVESKPEELRIFFEEAASISKYKERRRETERRIEQTRENLARLSDIRLELGKQLETLEKQAEVAKRYKALKAEERALDYWRIQTQRREIEQQLAALAKEGDAENRAFQSTVEQFNGAVEALFEGKGALEAEEAKLKVCNEQYYGAKEQIEKCKHQLMMLNELKYRDGENLAEWEARASALTEEMATAKTALKNVQAAQEELAITEALSDEAVATLDEGLIALEAEHGEAQKTHQTWLEQLNQQSQTISLNQNRQSYEQERLAQIERELERLAREKSALPNEANSQAAQEEQQMAMALEEEAIAGLKQQESEHTAQLNEVNALLERLRQKRERAVEERSELRGRISALMALIANRNEADPNSPLYERLEVKGGWNRAVDHALSRWLTLSTESSAESHILGSEQGEFTPDHLGYYIESDLQLGSLLSHVKIVDDEASLPILRENLVLHEWLVTKEGDLYGRDWQLLAADNVAADGLLEREAEIESAEERLALVEMSLEEMGQSFSEAEAMAEAEQEALANLRRSLAERSERLNQCHMEWRLLTQANQHQAEAATRLKSQWETLSEERAQVEGKIEELTILLVSAEERYAEDQERFETFSEKMAALSARYQQERQTVESKRATLHQQTRERDRLAHEAASHQKSIERASTEWDALNRRIAEMNISDAYDEKIEEQNVALVMAEEHYATVEAERNRLQQAVERIQKSLTTLEKNRTTAEAAIAQHREQIQAYALKERELQTQQNMVEESWETLQEELTAAEIEGMGQEYVDLAPSDIRSLLSSVRQKLSKIGAVNLVAIEESKTLAERKRYLDAQDEDLNRALQTLENAIREIDQETRARFMETFNQVNEDFGRLFPHLFGGGEAYLQLTDDDALTSGVNIIAHPPGKKPGTIHLLSGGEKAMTAMALVFAIFNLNPAPFCMLDEVDAPLDEANVRRLGSLINEMSEKVQFIFITHNKTTMTISDTLTGVTMSEPGVSRIVSVNLEEALQYSQASSDE